MTRWLAPLLLPLAGCIVYDTDGKCWDCEDGHQDVPGEDGGLDGDPSTPDDTGGVVGYKFLLDPAEAHAGDTFIAHLTQTGSFDLGAVTEAEFIDGPAILAMEGGSTELLFTIQVPADEPAGKVSLLLFTADGGNEYVPDVLTILEADPNQGGNGDTGGCP